MQALTALLAGSLFGAGLLLSGMTNPANVVAFLDITGHWRPALALTMLAAVLVALPAFTWTRRKGRSWLRAEVDNPDRRRIDAPLLVGSTVFGLGWGLSGLCPGPALILLTTLDPRALIFIAGLILGSYAGIGWSRRHLAAA